MPAFSSRLFKSAAIALCLALLCLVSFCPALAPSAYAGEDGGLAAGSVAAGVLQAQGADVANDATIADTTTDERAFSTQAAGDIAMYRMYNMFSGEHLYTADKNERNKLVKIGWFYEGIGWMAPATGDPVYRLYNKWSGDHHYTLDAKERDRLVTKGWKYEGTAWRTAAASDADAVALLRQFNPYAKTGTHNYTTSQKENDKLVKIGWRAEGVGWYGHAVPADYSDDMQPWKANVSGDEWLDRRIYYITTTHPSLRECFDYVINEFSYIEGNEFRSNPHYLPDKTTIAYAKEMLKTPGGNCYRFASLMEWLARGLGYEANAVSGWVPSYSQGKAPHGWTEVVKNGKTYVCDCSMANAVTDRNWFMRTYANAPVDYGSW